MPGATSHKLTRWIVPLIGILVGVPAYLVFTSDIEGFNQFGLMAILLILGLLLLVAVLMLGHEARACVQDRLVRRARYA